MPRVLPADAARAGRLVFLLQSSSLLDNRRLARLALLAVSSAGRLATDQVRELRT
ncbi:MAG: hypothetical protein ABI224_17755 [Acetobacteraceae bacterium]